MVMEYPKMFSDLDELNREESTCSTSKRKTVNTWKKFTLRTLLWCLQC